MLELKTGRYDGLLVGWGPVGWLAQGLTASSRGGVGVRTSLPHSLFAVAYVVSSRRHERHEEEGRGGGKRRRR